MTSAAARAVPELGRRNHAPLPVGSAAPFFWGFALTLLGEAWAPLYAAGIVATAAKEALDLWSKGFWSWDDFGCGLAGSSVALWHCGVMPAGTAG